MRKALFLIHLMNKARVQKTTVLFLAILRLVLFMFSGSSSSRSENWQISPSTTSAFSYDTNVTAIAHDFKKSPIHVQLEPTSISDQPSSPVFCKECQREFSSKRYLQIHQTIVHEQKERFCCYFCGEKLQSKLSLNKHTMGQHLREYPYSCMGKKCRFTTANRAYWFSHLKEKHSEGRSFLWIIL